MKPSNPAAITGHDEPLKANFLDGLADALEVPEAKRCSFKEEVQRAAREFQAERAAPKVDVTRREITSLAKAIARILLKPTQKKKESLQRRLNGLSPEAIYYLLRHHPPHDRDILPWGSLELTPENLESLYVLCCVGTLIRNKNGVLKAVTNYGPVNKPGPPQDHAKMTLVIRLGAAFHTAKGTYPERADIVLMTDCVLEKLGEPVKQDRDWQDTHMARKYLRLLKELHDAVPPSRAPAKGKRHFEGG